MNILAFESSCDETACAVVSAEDGLFSIKSNIIASQVDVHRLYGGVVPEIASRAHTEAISRITYEALDAAGVTLRDIALVAVTANPGLIGALLVGVSFAKALAIRYGIPLVAVDHIKGHIASAYLKEGRAPTAPQIALVVSGGHTAIYRVNSLNEVKVIGTTRDDAIGEAFDKIGRIIGIPYPAGAGFDALAREGFIKTVGEGDGYFKRFKRSEVYKSPALTLPSPALRDGTLDFSFSGLKTAAINLIHRYEMRGDELPRAEFAARYTYEAVEAVYTKLKEALSLEENADCEMILAGGVGANSHLRQRLSELAVEMKRKFTVADRSLCGDNAAMIAVAGFYEYERGNIQDAALNASALDGIV